MRTFLRDKGGSVPILSFGLLFAVLLLAFLVIEMGAAYENYDHCQDTLQRCVNSAVEANISDAYRADGVLRLDTAGAEQDFYAFMAADLSARYAITVSSVTCTVTPPSMTVVGTISFDTVFSQYGWDDLTFDFKVRATNYRLE